MDKVLEVLKKGMATELWGMRFYEQAVARTESGAGKKVFQSLVAEEEGHLDILRGEYASVAGDKDWVSREEAKSLAASVDPEDIFPKVSAVEALIPEDATDEQALEMAMDFEMRGFKLYDEAAKQASSPAEKAVWDFLAKAEDAHYTFLQKTYDYLTTNGVWYFDDQELPFFEG